jgi:hypothetical protein
MEKRSYPVDEQGFPFTETLQEAIVGHCLNNSEFFMHCYTRLKPSWFTRDAMVSNLFDQLCKSYDKYHVPCKNYNELLNEPFFLKQSEGDKDKYKARVLACVFQAVPLDPKTAAPFSLEKVKKHLTAFIRLCLFKEAVEGAARRYNSQGMDEAYDWTKKKIKEIDEASFESNIGVMSFDKPEGWLADEMLVKEEAMSTGNRRLDYMLGGGLFKGETSAIMAPVNSGKSTFLITLARHLAFQGKKVLYITHEDSPRKIRRRILSCFLAVNRNTLLNPEILKDMPTKAHLIAATQFLDKYLTYMPYNHTGAMFIEDVSNEIKRMHELEKARTGKGYDVVIDDYPKKLKLKNRAKDNLYRAELAEVYDYFNQLAIELDVHCFVAVQTNREGAKQNSGKVKSEDNLGMDMVDESFGIAQNLGNIMTLNRSSEDKNRHVLTISITKSRNDITDIALSTRTNYGCTLTHGDRNMFDFANSLFNLQMIPGYKSLVDTDLKYKYLASYGNSTNKKTNTLSVDEILKKLENSEINEHENFKEFLNSMRELQGGGA